MYPRNSEKLLLFSAEMRRTQRFSVFLWRALRLCGKKTAYSKLKKERLLRSFLFIRQVIN